MKKILIPIDFSLASVNSVNYAAALSHDSNAQEILLVANAHLSEFEQVFPSPDFLPAQLESKEERETELNKNYDDLQTVISGQLKIGVKLSFKITHTPLLSSLHELVMQELPDLIILGSDYNDDAKIGFIGEHLLKIAKESTIPVLIVPESTRYEAFRQVLVPFNSSNAMRLNLLTIADIFKIKPQLLLLNVKDEITGSFPLENDPNENERLTEMAGNYTCSFYYAQHQEPMAAINAFLKANEVQLLIALPGQHGFFYRLTHQSITAGMAENYLKPVLILNANNGFGE